MTNEELKYKITDILPTATFDESGEFLNVLIASNDLLALMKELNSNKEFDFDYLFNMTCIDWKDHLVVVYHLLSKTLKHCIVVQAKIADVINPQIESVDSIWKTAELNRSEEH